MQDRLRTPPHNAAAEKTILGQILFDLHGPKAINSIVDILSPEDFYIESHAIIYQAMLDLLKTKAPIEVVALHTQLKKNKLLERVGGSPALSGLALCSASSSNIEYYADLVVEAANHRKIIELGHALQDKDTELEDAISKGEAGLKAIANSRAREGGFVPAKDILDKTWGSIDNALETGYIGEPGILSGFRDLDKLLRGHKNTNLTYIAARPGMGKTAYMLNLVLAASIASKKSSGIFSLEMSSQQLMTRMISIEAQLPLDRLIEEGSLSQEDFKKVTQASERIREANIWIDDNGKVSVLKIAAYAERLKATKGLDILFIDFLQRISGGEGRGRVEQLSSISRDLKSLAKSLDIPVVCLSQINRDCEDRKPPIPRLADLKGSGGQEEDADEVIFLYRREYYEKANTPCEDKGICLVDIAKNKHGSPGRVKLRFQAEWPGFQDRGY